MTPKEALTLRRGDILKEGDEFYKVDRVSPRGKIKVMEGEGFLYPELFTLWRRIKKS